MGGERWAVAVDDWAEVDRAIGEIAGSSCAEVREDGEWLAEFADLHWELRREGKQPLVHLWSDERNLTRRVLRVKERSEDRIVLEVQQFGRTKPAQLAFLRTDSTRTPKRITREQFRARFRRILSERFPDAKVETLTASPDLKHSFSGLYVRGRMHEGARAWALLAAAPTEDATAIDGILTFGILWLDWTRSHAGKRAVEGLRLFLPEGSTRAVRERILALSPATRVEIYELSGPDARMQKMDPCDAGNLESWLTTRGQIEAAVAAARGAFARIRALSPDSSDVARDLTARVVPRTHDVAFGFRGLEFAWFSPEGISFGTGDSRRRLTAATEPALERLLHQLDLHRSALAEETNHILYRAAPERWLETLIQEDSSRLDAQLDPAHLYPQVPALAAGDRGVLDLLGVTRRGRLVVIELKASEDIQLPIQAVDYWLRVRRHQREGDFARYGYFAGVELDPSPPLVWLVAPGLRFHSASDVVLKYLAPEIHVTRIGLNENWRGGVRVIFRQ
jgi:hypothetical protein